MKGIVVEINPRNGFIAVETSAGEYAVLELLGGDIIEKGDVISGNLSALGSEEVTNNTQDEEMDVFIQAIGCSISRVYQQMSLN